MFSFDVGPMCDCPCLLWARPQIHSGIFHPTTLAFLQPDYDHIPLLSKGWFRGADPLGGCFAEFMKSGPNPLKSIYVAHLHVKKNIHRPKTTYIHPVLLRFRLPIPPWSAARARAARPARRAPRPRQFGLREAHRLLQRQLIGKALVAEQTEVLEHPCASRRFGLGPTGTRATGRTAKVATRSVDPVGSSRFEGGGEVSYWRCLAGETHCESHQCVGGKSVSMYSYKRSWNHSSKNLQPCMSSLCSPSSTFTQTSSPQGLS